ncbi:MAG: hypothetical protein JNL57_00455 [Bacteroidetes bacterium]|nr:hypothetical protein [Bacteroidota bacterium]
MRRLWTLITYVFFPGTMAVAGACFPYFPTKPFGPLVHWQQYFWPSLLIYIVLPSAGVWLMIKIGWISDFHIVKRKERNVSYPLAIVPAAALTLYYFFFRIWPGEKFPFLWSGSITLVLALLWLINSLWIKASAHMAGVGGFLSMIIALHFNPYTHFQAIWIGISMVVCALVYMARLGLSAHSHKELWVGFGLGFLTTFAVLSL